MLSLPVLAEVTGQVAEATTVHAESVNPVTEFANNFGVNLPAVIGQIINFCIVAYVLWRFAFKPVLATLDERQKKIADGLRYAEETKARLDSAQQESAETLKKAQVEAAAIIEQARKASKELAERETTAATARAGELISKAQQAIELEKQKMLAEARTEIARLVIATTQRVLSKELNDADRTRYNEAAARELTSV
ncbi:MAG TPA: F0F1 ATP synthase subunit B [Rariglobus sp.]|jgi:F-type H+-transporting ATPase subunit b|nr:F0F1 ATP synthase subunit B [Rariglobus sp.]